MRVVLSLMRNLFMSLPNKEKDTKLKIGSHLNLSKHKSFFAKGYSPNWSKEVFVIKKLRILCRRHM